MPSASAIAAIVLAVPITMQVPVDGKSSPWTASRRAASSAPARCSLQTRRQSVHAPRRVPSKRPVSIGPAVTTIAGRSALAAPMSWAGRVLSQPPSRTTPSMGWPRIISSVSIAIRLRKSMLVGER